MSQAPKKNSKQTKGKTISVNGTFTPSKGKKSGPKQGGNAQKSSKQPASPAPPKPPAKTGLPPSNTESFEKSQKNTEVRTIPASSVTSSVQRSVVSIVPDATSVAGIAATLVVHALAMGWGPGDAQNAFTALQKELISSMADKVLVTARAPKFFWELADGLRPASKGGFSYLFDTTAYQTGVQMMLAAPSGYWDAVFVNGVADSTGLQPAYGIATGPVAYAGGILTNQESDALTRLWAYYEAIDNAFELGPYDREKTVRYRDSISAFAGSVAMAVTPWQFGNNFGPANTSALGIEIEDGIDIIWLAHLCLAPATDIHGVQRTFRTVITRTAPMCAYLGHRLVNRLYGGNRLNEEVRMCWYPLEAVIKAAYISYNKALVKRNDDVRGAIPSGGAGQPDKDPVPFNGLPTNKFAIAVYFIVKNYFAKWASTFHDAGNSKINNRAVVFSEWNACQTLTQDSLLPAALVEGLRSIQPVTYIKKKETRYPVLAVGAGFLAAFDAWVAIQQTTSGMVGSGLLVTATSDMGGTSLELTTGRIAAAPYSGTYNICSGNAVATIVSFQGSSQQMADNLLLGDASPGVHEVEMTLMHNIAVLSAGLTPLELEQKADKKFWGRIKRPSLAERYERKCETVGKKPDQKILRKLEMCDRLRGLPIGGDYEFLSDEVPPSVKESINADPTNFLLTGTLGYKELNADSVADNGLFLPPMAYSTDPNMTDVSGYYAPGALQIVSGGAQKIMYSDIFARQSQLAHSRAALPSSSDADMIRTRSVLGMGANSGSTSKWTKVGNAVTTSLDAIFSFF